MNHNTAYPAHSTTAIRMEKLIKITGKRSLPDRMSSRIVKCASVLDQDGFIGWQMLVPKKGLLDISLFGSGAIGKSDLEWIAEKTGKPSGRKLRKTVDESLTCLYELFLPVTEGKAGASIGFRAMTPDKEADGFAKWPAFFPQQFEELVNVLRITGAAFRAVVGPAELQDQQTCRKNTIRTYDVSGVAPSEYIGHPVRARILLRLPAAPSARLKTVLEEAVHGLKLRLVGHIPDAGALAVWDSPLTGAPVLPDYAARIMVLEPELWDTITGIEACEEEVKSIPASHKNPKDKRAVTIGRATDTSGIKRRITIGEMDLQRHYQIVGQTGTGKSTLLTSIILSAVRKGHGLTFFDPHGSTIDTILRSLPEEFADRIRVVRIGDTEHPVPMNIWNSDDPEKEERTINDLCELFGDIFNPPGECYLGPRWERWFSTFAKASIAFLGRRASLESISVISQSKDNMLKVSRAIIGKYPELVETIKQEYGLDRSNDWNSTLSWLLCKFQRLTAVEQLRKTLGAGTNALDFGHTIDTDTVTLIDLASPVIGSQAARIAGTLIMMKLWNAAMERKERDKTHLVVVDEASLFQTNPMPRMLAESRKFGISMILCHQHAGQLTSEIRDALEANSANFSAFRLSPRDASTAAIRLDNPEMQASLARLDAFHAVTTISVDGKQTAPFTLETIRPKYQRNGVEIARRIEAHSIETLVEPYRALRALKPAEILDLLDHPEKLAAQDPAWLNKWKRRRSELAQVC